MSQRFGADQALQLFQSFALESSDDEYLDSESDKVNNVIADIQNEKDSSDYDIQGVRKVTIQSYKLLYRHPAVQ